MKNLSKYLLLVLVIAGLSSCYRNGNYAGPKYKYRMPQHHFHAHWHANGNYY